MPAYATPNPIVAEFLSRETSSTFLISMRQTLARYDRLTVGQLAAVQRIMVEQGYTMTAVGGGEEVWTEPGEPVDPVVGPANHNECVTINNGSYFFAPTAGEDGTQFKIFTIRSTRSEGLLNKRAISYYDEENDRWVTFGFLRTNGTFQLWTRFRSMEDSPQVRDANGMLAVLRLNPNTALRNLPSATGEVTIDSQNCRYCQDRLLPGSREVQIGHDNCRQHRLASPPLTGNPTAPDEGPFRYSRVERVRPLFEAAPQQPLNQPVSTLSELGSGWEQ